LAGVATQVASAVVPGSAPPSNHLSSVAISAGDITTAVVVGGMGRIVS
jgi:hypothetical protein